MLRPSAESAEPSIQLRAIKQPGGLPEPSGLNARSNASGAGKNYAIQFAGTAPNPTGLTSNNNDLLANGTGGFVGDPRTFYVKADYRF